MPSLTEYLKRAGIYKPQPGSLAEVLAKPEVKKEKVWTYHYPDFKTGKPVAIKATSQTEARKQAGALGLSTTEVLSTWKGKPKAKEIQKGITEAQKRLQEIIRQIGAEGVATKAGEVLISPYVSPAAGAGVGAEVVEEVKEVKEEKEEVAPLTGLYDVSKIQTSLTSAGTKKKEAYDEMIGLQSSLYEDEYNKAGMGGIKSKIARVDTEISNRKAKRDQSLLTEKGKPIPQWMITGRKALEIEAATGDLNRLIDQRNGLADQYNSGIDEVTRKVGYGTQDAATKYGYWENEEKRLTDLMGTYQSLMATELGRAEVAERWEKEFALKLAEAEKVEKPKTASITYSSGGRLYLRTYNAETGETIKTEDLGPAPPTGVDTKSLQVIKDDYSGKAIGYFNPATGKTHYYTEEEGGPGVELEFTAFTNDQMKKYIREYIRKGWNEASISTQIDKDGTISPGQKAKMKDVILPEEWKISQEMGFWERFRSKIY